MNPIQYTVILLGMLCSNISAQAKVYYVSQSTGDDHATGLVQEPGQGVGPLKTLAKVSTIPLIAGDRVMLKCGDTWTEEFLPKGDGSATDPIIISYYGKGPKPVIDGQDFKQDRAGIRFTNQGGYKIIGIEFNRCMTGIYAEYADNCPIQKFMWIEDCYFHDSLMYRHYEDYPKTKIGLGICFFTFELQNTKVLTDITIKNCVFRRLASGIWTNSPDNFNKSASYIYPFGNMNLEACLFEEGYQWPMGIRGVEMGRIRNCVTHDIGRGFRSFNGVAGSMFFRCKNWVIEDSEWGFVDIGNGSGDGEAFDIEGNCDNMLVRNCLFHDTDGPCFLLCCYSSDGNPSKKILIENCVLNGKAKRPPRGTGKSEIFNTTDHNESTWKKCRFYLSPGESLMKVADPEKEKLTKFEDCVVKNLSQACSSVNFALKATITASSTQIGSNAMNVSDDKVETVWRAEKPEGQWLELTFAVATTLNEFRLNEDPSSEISRYVIECWDSGRKQWINCFNGSAIGHNFIAPIVSRTTQKVRLMILKTSRGNPGIAEFSAYHDMGGELFNDSNGTAACGKVGN